VCPYEGYPCGAKDASLIFAYNVNYGPSPEIEFTIGGRLTDNNVKNDVHIILVYYRKET